MIFTPTTAPDPTGAADEAGAEGPDFPPLADAEPVAVPAFARPAMAAPPPVAPPPPPPAAAGGGARGGGGRAGIVTKADRLFGQEPPYNLEAEARLLSCCFIDRGEIAMELCAQAGLTPDAFYSPAHQLVFQRIVELHAQKGYIDEVLLTDALEHHQELERVGGAVAIAKLGGLVASIAGAPYWTEVVVKQWKLRRLIRDCTQTLHEAYATPESPEHLIEKLDRALQETNTLSQSGTLQTTADALPAVLARLDTAPSEDLGLTLGFPELDAFFGLRPGEVIVFGARPGMGKTTLALQIALRVAVDLGQPVLFASLEMGTDRLLPKALAHLSGYAIDWLHQASGPAKGALAHAAQRLRAAPLWWETGDRLLVSHLRALARRVQRQHGALGLVVVDYLQLVTPPKRDLDRHLQIADITSGLKKLARALGVPVLALSQLNRATDKERTAPQLSDLRESGSIEQDADSVLLGWNPTAASENPDPRAVQLLVRKQRNGSVGCVDLVFDKKHHRFRPRPADGPAEPALPFDSRGGPTTPNDGF